MLLFNPFFRLTIDECLDHSFFKRCRKPEKEQEAQEVIKLEWDKDNLDISDLRQLFIEEIKF
jgi:serine/threonine protein kinase